MAEVAASATITEAEFANFEDVSDTSYEVRHTKAEVEERKRWSQPLKVIGMGSTSSRNRSGRRQNSQADSGCNTPDPMSPGMLFFKFFRNTRENSSFSKFNFDSLFLIGSVEKVDSVEVNTRPSTPDEIPAPNAIKNRRRTSSTTLKSRDRNPSEDSPRCPTPGTSEFPVPAQPLQPPPVSLYPQIDPYEPRKFPLPDEEYSVMCEEMPSGFDIAAPTEQPEEPEEVDSVENVPSTAASTSNPVTSSRRASSQESSNFDDEVQEMEDEDPDWSGDMEDPDDPEWTSREEVQQNNVKTMKKPPVKKPPVPSVHAPHPPVQQQQPQQQPPKQPQNSQQQCFNAN